MAGNVDFPPTGSRSGASLIDFSHPLYLYPSDTQAMTLVTQVLTGSENYVVWSQAVRIALIAKNKIGIVDGTCTRDKQELSLQEQWDRCNAVVLSWLMNSVDKELAGGLAFSQNARLVWVDLQQRFDKRDGTKIYTLHRAVNSLSQGVMTVSSYFTKLKELWDEFAALVPTPSCQCEVSKEHVRIAQEQKLFQFLMGLNESFQLVRS